jgi:hypothetical protein
VKRLDVREELNYISLSNSWRVFLPNTLADFLPIFCPSAASTLCYFQLLDWREAFLNFQLSLAAWATSRFSEDPINGGRSVILGTIRDPGEKWH